MSQVQITNIEQAKWIISMKNDQIRKITNDMKKMQKKSNIKLAQNNYQIQQQKNKLTDLQKKTQKLKQTHQLQLKKFEQSQQKLKTQISALKQSVNELQKNERQTERSHKAQLYEMELKMNEQRQKRHNLKRQYQTILKLFNPKQIIMALNLTPADELVPYLKLIQKCREQEQQINSMNSKLQQYKSDSLKAMQDTFSKLNSYQQVMTTLKQKNSQLQQIMLQTQKNLEQKDMQLEHKANMLLQVQQFTTQKYNQMSEQIESLRRSVRNYERESLNYQQSKQQHEKNLKFIFELSSEFEHKQQDYLHKITQLQAAFQNIEHQKQEIERQYNEHMSNYKESINQFQTAVARAEKNVKDKQEIINMVTNGLKELENENQAHKQELERSKLEISELIRRKIKLQEQLRQAEQFYQSKQQSLLEEIEMLRNMRGSAQFKQEERKQQVSKAGNSLQDDLQPQPNWLEMYENCLQRHNKFIREVHYLLHKQQRKQSVSVLGQDTMLNGSSGNGNRIPVFG